MTSVLGPDAVASTPQTEDPPAPNASTVIDIDLDSDLTMEQQLAAQADKLKTAVGAPAEPTAEDELFEGKQFEVRATIDGESADKIVIKYSGTQTLDPNDPKDVAFFEKMFLGRKLTLQVEAEVSGKNGQIKTDKNDDSTVTGTATLKVVHVYEPTPEELA